ncbi:sirohydrochlorin chelatase [Desulfuribacillus alkaliarsenatis]|uniref:Cobalamin biosynthesis protein CbiX n=1 Tax=Desulfuribacillus alkaliarsenatis TaxID=766136 RepID=A0A1E5FZV8_9FIRM|nr:CbiX/SirB N-terminal domain-containing protein [Desulfuribacillus alkaliarsenatis]OEF96033.1 hypothetical protein BHF68_09815 [Desulfuribacillus alkaliarsenatis]
MKKIVILLGHGSRNVDSINEQKELYKLIAAAMPDYEIRNAFLQLCSPKFENILNEVIEANYNSIIVVPIFLFAGNHVQSDIPEIITDFKEKHPNIEIVLTKHIGADNKLVELVQQRILNI